MTKYLVTYTIGNKVLERHGIFGLNRLDIPFSFKSACTKYINKLKQTGRYKTGKLNYEEI